MPHSNDSDLVAIALLVKEFNSKKDRATQALGRMTLQKLIYFLNETDTPLSYEFEPYYYGPFCEDIYSDTKQLQIDGIINDESFDPDRSIFLPGNAMDSFLNSNKSIVKQFQKNVAKVVHLFSNLLPNDMELAASVHHIYSSLSASGTAPSEDVIVTSIQTWKPGRFLRKNIVHVLTELKRLNLLAN